MLTVCKNTSDFSSDYKLITVLISSLFILWTGMEQNGEGKEKSVCRPKFVKFLDNAWEPSYFSVPLSDCLCQVSFRRYSPLSVKVVEKQTNVKVSWSPFFPGRTTPTVLQHIVSVIYHPPFGKVCASCLLISVCKTWQWSRMQNLHRWVKMAVEFEAVCGPKFMLFWDDVGDPL